MRMSEQIAKLAEALSKAQGAMRGAVKDSANPFYKSRYADLSAVWDACREPLSLHGLSVVQVPEIDPNGKLTISTILMHSSGEWISGDLVMTPVKDDPQGIGSACTYARRYALSAFVGIAPEEDDGNAASGKEAKDNAPVKRSFGSAVGNKASAVVAKGPAAQTADVRDIGIDKGQAVNLHRSFRDALREDMQPKADELLAAWLTKQGFVDADGRASTLKIPKDLFGEFKKEIEEYARAI